MSNGTQLHRSRTTIVIASAYGVVCHALFIAGVGAMMYEMFFGMARSLGSLHGPSRLIVNGLLLAQFPIAHSLLLTRVGRTLMTRLAPRQIARQLSTTIYAVIASVQVGLLFTLWSPSGTVWWRADGTMLVVMLCLDAAAWLLLLKAIIDAGFAMQVGLLGWWAVARDRSPAYPPMPRAGLFRLCRQPIYVAFALTLWTVSTITPDQLVVSSILTFYCLVGPLFKEARFRRMFGQKFTDYQQAIPYWLPWTRSFRGTRGNAP